MTVQGNAPPVGRPDPFVSTLGHRSGGVTQLGSFSCPNTPAGGAFLLLPIFQIRIEHSEAMTQFFIIGD